MGYEQAISNENLSLDELAKLWGGESALATLKYNIDCGNLDAFIQYDKFDKEWRQIEKEAGLLDAMEFDKSQGIPVQYQAEKQKILVTRDDVTAFSQRMNLCLPKKVKQWIDNGKNSASKPKTRAAWCSKAMAYAEEILSNSKKQRWNQKELAELIIKGWDLHVNKKVQSPLSKEKSKIPSCGSIIKEVFSWSPDSEKTQWQIWREKFPGRTSKPGRPFNKKVLPI